jgi:hypothetical protein
MLDQICKSINDLPGVGERLCQIRRAREAEAVTGVYGNELDSSRRIVRSLANNPRNGDVS